MANTVGLLTRPVVADLPPGWVWVEDNGDIRAAHEAAGMRTRWKGATKQREDTPARSAKQWAVIDIKQRRLQRRINGEWVDDIRD